MTPTTTLLLLVSLTVLVLGGYLWTLTSSRSLLVNALMGSACLLLAAYHSGSHPQLELAILLPFFTTMIFAGRAMGTWWRSRQEADLRRPAHLMTAVAALSFTATISTYLSL